MMHVSEERRVERSLSFQAKREVLHQMAPQYREASLSKKRILLEAFVATTGYVPKYARWLLNHAEEVQRMVGCSHLRRYGADVQHVLFLVWNAAKRICAKRFIPLLPTLIEALERHRHSSQKNCRSRMFMGLTSETNLARAV
jgi:hypothetical protein